MLRMRAYGWGERSVAPHSTPSPPRSDENANEPCTLAIPSGRTGEAPSTSRWRGRVSVAVIGRHSLRAHRLASRHRHLLDGGQDPAVAGAPADVAGELLPDLDLGRLG